MVMPSSKPEVADEKFMRLALVQARRGLGKTHPNPTVGAVIVKGGRVVSSGWHRGAGRPHAEIEAIRAWKKPTTGATIYITLEPCSTHGRTPPCTDAIVAGKFQRVVYGATDPNPSHAGRARLILQQANIRVTDSVLARECSDLNVDWNKWIVTGMPYVIAKAALTLDGRIDSHPESRWISNDRSRRNAMKLRSRVGAIIVGAGTVRADNPHLTVRGIARALQPWRAVISRSGQLPPDSNLLTDVHRERTLIYSNLKSALRDLGKRGVVSALIEGGGEILGQAFDRALVDEVRFYLAPVLTGGKVSAVGGLGVARNVDAVRLESASYERFGNDVCLSGRVIKT
jgi:diaminohydroxyphosphoribosylaminopyrimidine deaminase / 5-amino-6-(5-phosphoribosylamino)uracil reductase